VRSSPPSLRRVVICCVVTWSANVVGVVLAIVTREWLIAVYALNAAIAAAGWLLATREWAAWKELAYGTLAAARFLYGGDDTSE